MTLEEALRSLAPFARPQEFHTEGLRQKFVSEKGSAKVVRVLGDAMTAGQLTTSVWRDVTSSSVPDDFIPALGRLWDDLVGARLADCADGFPENWTQETLRLWAYTNEWLMTSEDEDLALMIDTFVPGLLELAAEEACPKRIYILETMHHWARDTASGAAGRETFGDVVTRIAQRASLARQANDAELADYFLRLGSYATLAPVDREGAHQRGMDLTGCHEPRPGDVKVEQEVGCWRVEIPGAFPKTLRISQSDGRIY